MHRPMSAPSMIVVLAVAAGGAWAGEPAPTGTPAKPASEPPAAAGPKPTPAEPKPEQIISDLEKKAPPKPVASATPAATPTATPAPVSAAPASAAAGAAGGKPGKLLREGTFLASRKGRVIRASSGEWVFHFDQDAAAPGDPPMVLMPSMNLMAMEKLAERGGESLTFQVSGQVFVYHGRNYLLPSMYQVNHRAAGETGRQ